MPRFCTAGVLLILALFFLASPGESADRFKWRSYTNARFGYQLEYPPTLGARPESENGDGRMFVSLDGKKKLIVFASHNVTGRSMKEKFQSSLEDWSGDGKKVTYKAMGESWMVISGTDGDGIFYVKTIRSKTGDDEIDATMIFIYPASARKSYDRHTGRIAGSFRFKAKPR